MTKIVIFGDVHGRFSILEKQIKHAEEFNPDAYIQCGDFGIFRPVKLPTINKPFYFVIGNHEDEDAETQITEFPSNYHYLKPDIIETICDMKVVGISRSSYIDEWNTPPHGVIKHSDIIKAEMSGYIDLIVSHDCPTHARVTSTFFGPEENVGSDELDDVFENIKCDFWFFGHHHKNIVTPMENGGLLAGFTQIEFGYGVFDTERGTVEFISNHEY